MSESNATSGSSGPSDTETLPIAERRRAVTLRSLLLGSLGVLFVCGLSPYNDIVLTDTSLTAGFLPLAATLLLFVVVVGINAPLHRFAPRYALGTGELAVVMVMTLVSSALPGWGLMRFLIPTPVVPFYMGTASGPFWRAFESMGLPPWLFPVESIEEGRSSDVVNWFYNSIPRDGGEIPWAAWIVPLAAWGVFIIAMLATLIALARIVIDQWMINERLPFPIAQVQADLLMPPRRGRALNPLLRSRAMWITLGLVFAVHSINAMNAYQPTYFPRIPLGYDMTTMFTEGWTDHLRTKIKTSQLSFMVIGVTYFIRTRAAFSLWAIFLACSMIDVGVGQYRGGSVGSAAWGDQHFGACIAFLLGIAWIGRHQWKQVLLNAVGAGRDSSYRLSFWIAVIGIVVMVGWLMVVGVKLWIAILIVAFIVGAHLVVSRVVAETGLPNYRASINMSHVYNSMDVSAFTAKDMYFSSVFTVLGPVTTRDSMMTFAQQGMAITHRTGVTGERAKIGFAIAWAVLLGLFVAGASTLWCHYNYPTPVSRDIAPQGNNFGAIYLHERDVRNPVLQHAEGRTAQFQHNTWTHVGIGFVVTALLQVLTLSYASWPLLPVGFVASHGAFISNTWFSIFLGWIVKVMLVRFGGASLYQAARPAFIGLIFGEALAAGFWLIINAIVVLNGHDPQVIKFLL